jgi:tRNA pseudouridine55 synthase
VLDFAYPRLDLEITCGKGTYIRSLARDLGRRLGCGGYLASLRRTCIGIFAEADAIPLDAPPPYPLRPLADALADAPRLTLDEPALVRFANGQTLPTPEGFAADVEIAVVDAAGNLRAVARVEPVGLRPVKVIRGR